ncbi:MAG TPA: NFACT family protein [Candidatus Eremiobacteraceae bacterium]|nr:NFACT family protein [Candidatus Eremiobacteraceae bacterium]
MTLDVWLVARLAAELRDALTGARVRSVTAGDGGMRIACYRRGLEAILRATLGPDGPLLALHSDPEPENENVAGGWAGGVAPLLRGCSVESVQAVPDDRIVFLDVVSRSAFGVPARHRVAFELEPNKANILVLRPGDDERWQILAAAKEFEGAHGARSIEVGESYRLPPPRTPKLDTPSFALAIDAESDLQPRVIARLLGEFDVSCTPPLARDVVERATQRDAGRPLSERLLQIWLPLRERVAAAAADITAPVFAWGSGAVLDVVHLVALSWPPGDMQTLPDLNEACVRSQSSGDRKRMAPAEDALRKRLLTMIERCDKERASLEAAQRRAIEAERLKEAGDAIYTYLADIEPRADALVTPEGLRVELDPALAPKDNAAAYFRRYKKAKSGMPRVAQRLGVLERNRAFWESLLWELDRAASDSPAALAAMCDEIADAIGRNRATAKRSASKRAASRVVDVPGGAVAHVGRSPKDNERVTFTVGAPNDLWFHARGVPGAHVILKLRDPRDRPSDEQIIAAAALAAGQSRAAAASKVEVDFTQRKHVRKQGGSRPGLVWYTDFRTVLVEPVKA